MSEIPPSFKLVEFTIAPVAKSSFSCLHCTVFFVLSLLVTDRVNNFIRSPPWWKRRLTIKFPALYAKKLPCNNFWHSTINFADFVNRLIDFWCFRLHHFHCLNIKLYLLFIIFIFFCFINIDRARGYLQQQQKLKRRNLCSSLVKKLWNMVHKRHRRLCSTEMK